MTRKDYIQTANILKSFVDEIPQTTYEDLVQEFADWFQSETTILISQDLKRLAVLTRLD